MSFLYDAASWGDSDNDARASLLRGHKASGSCVAAVLHHVSQLTMALPTFISLQMDKKQAATRRLLHTAPPTTTGVYADDGLFMSCVVLEFRHAILGQGYKPSSSMLYHGKCHVLAGFKCI
ncbi:TPA: hypothetical protein ACH3X2_009228 [Trebouxia sp. C0005]